MQEQKKDIQFIVIALVIAVACGIALFFYIPHNSLFIKATDFLIPTDFIMFIIPFFISAVLAAGIYFLSYWLVKIVYQTVHEIVHHDEVEEESAGVAFIGQIGRNILTTIDYFGGITSLLAFTLLELFKQNKKGRRFIWNITKMQILYTGVDAMGLVAFISIAIASIIIILASMGENALQMVELVRLLIPAIIREIGPLMVSIIVVARSGTAISIEIGNMMVNSELDAIETMGIDPLRFIVLPRILGMVISSVVLDIYFGFFGIFGAAIIRQIFMPLVMHEAVSIKDFFVSFFTVFELGDLLMSIIKSAVIGAFVSVICIYHGFKVGNSPTMVPVGAIKAVVNSFIYMFVINIFFSVIYIIAKLG